MSENINILEKIDNYLEGLMSDEERSAFEKQIASDSNLATQVEEIRLTNEAIYLASLSVLKEQIGKDIKQIKHKPDSNLGKYITGASVLIIGMLTIPYLMRNDSSQKIEKETIKKQTIVVEESTVIMDSKTDTIISATPKSIPSAAFSSSKNSVSSKKLEGVKNEVFTDRSIEVNETVEVEMKPMVLKNTIEKHDKNIEESTIKCIKSFNIETKSTCRGKETGEIIIRPKNSTLDKAILDNGIENSSGIFNEVSAGIHQLEVKMTDECVFYEQTDIVETWCPMNTSYSLNPAYNEKWQLIYENGSNGVLTILNRLGKEVYRSDFNGQEVYWDGSDNQGRVVPLDVYIAIVSYTDGRMEKVELTVVR